ncbi:hypothetical protein PFISCL1PPCAC_24518, partial [Pristionchus fissidentatus]
QMEKSLQRLSSMPLTAEIMYRTGAAKVLRGYFSHSTLGSLARSIVEESDNAITSTSSDNEWSLSPDTHAGFTRKRHITEDTVAKWKRPRLSSSEDTDEETFSRRRKFTRSYGRRTNE